MTLSENQETTTTIDKMNDKADFFWPLKEEVKWTVEKIFQYKNTDNNGEDNQSKKVENEFDKEGEDEDTINMFNAESWIVKELLDIQDNDNVLDLWCWYWKYIKLFWENNCSQITWIDLSKKSLKKAKERNKDIWAKYKKWNILNIKIPNNTFDKVNCWHVLKFLLDQEKLEKAFMEVYRVLKPGWIFVFSNNAPKWKELFGKNENWEAFMKLHTMKNYKQASEKSWLEISEYKFKKYNNNWNHVIVMKLRKHWKTPLNEK
jgi:SAM-dependent methyltransferase